MLTTCSESHLDHVPGEVIDWVLEVFKGCQDFGIHTFTLPDHLSTLENALYGPACSDEAITDAECFHSPRRGRNYDSRLCSRPVRDTRTCTLFCGESSPGAKDCVIYTLLGGPASPREVKDPYLREEDRWRSALFWAQHALSRYAL
jgi:hypothetical protein